VALVAVVTLVLAARYLARFKRVHGHHNNLARAFELSAFPAGYTDDLDWFWLRQHRLRAGVRSGGQRRGHGMFTRNQRRRRNRRSLGNDNSVGWLRVAIQALQLAPKHDVPAHHADPRFGDYMWSRYCMLTAAGVMLDWVPGVDANEVSTTFFQQTSDPFSEFAQRFGEDFIHLLQLAPMWLRALMVVLFVVVFVIALYLEVVMLLAAWYYLDLAAHAIVKTIVGVCRRTWSRLSENVSTWRRVSKRKPKENLVPLAVPGDFVCSRVDGPHFVVKLGERELKVFPEGVPSYVQFPGSRQAVPEGNYGPMFPRVDKKWIKGLVTLEDSSGVLIGQGCRLSWRGQTYLLTAGHVYDLLGSEFHVCREGKRYRVLKVEVQEEVYSPYGNWDVAVFAIPAAAWSSLGVAALQPYFGSMSAVQIRAVMDEPLYMACTVEVSDSPFILYHASNTTAGWSGAPLLTIEETPKIVGVHTAEVISRMRNEATSIEILQWLEQDVVVETPKPRGRSYVEELGDRFEEKWEVRRRGQKEEWGVKRPRGVQTRRKAVPRPREREIAELPDPEGELARLRNLSRRQRRVSEYNETVVLLEKAVDEGNIQLALELEGELLKLRVPESLKEALEGWEARLPVEAIEATPRRRRNRKRKDSRPEEKVQAVKHPQSPMLEEELPNSLLRLVESASALGTVEKVGERDDPVIGRVDVLSLKFPIHDREERKASDALALGYVMPPRSLDVIKKSMRFHMDAGAAAREHKLDATDAEVELFYEEWYGSDTLDSDFGHLKEILWCDEQWKLGNRDVALVHLESLCLGVLLTLRSESNPGYPWCCTHSTIGAVRENQIARDAVVATAVLRMGYLLGWFREPLVREHEPWRVFEKMEPTKVAKVTEGRVRLILNIAVPDQIVETILCTDMDKAEIAAWERIPSKPGIGFDSGGVLKYVRSLPDPLLEESAQLWAVFRDFPFWDWTVSDSLRRKNAHCRAYVADQRVPSPIWFTVFQRWYEMEDRAGCVLPDGSLVPKGPHEQSGKVSTSSDNSRMRAFLAWLSGAWCAQTMGDDSGEFYKSLAAKEKADRFYASLPIPPKTSQEGLWCELARKGWEFCSHLFAVVENGHVFSSLVTFGKGAAHLMLCNERSSPEVKEMQGIVYLEEFAPRVFSDERSSYVRSERFLAFVKQLPREFRLEERYLEFCAPRPQSLLSAKMSAKKQKKAANRLAALENEIRRMALAPRKVGGAKARRRRRRGGNAIGAAPVALSNASVPRSSMTWESAGEGRLIVKGVELVRELNCHNEPSVEFSMVMNPLVMEMPRLQAISGGFEEFRFQRIRISYVPGCPATRSGVVMAAYIEDPLARDPIGAIETRAYETSFIGSVGIPMSSKMENEDQKIWWLTHPVSVSSDLGETFRDPTKRFQGKVVVSTSGAASADDGLLAGYLVVEYEVHLHSLRPARDEFAVFAHLGTDTQQVFTGGAADLLNVMEWPTLGQALGAWGWENSLSTRPGVDASYQESFYLDAAAWLFSLVESLGAAASVEEKRVVSPRQRSILRPKISRNGTRYVTQNVRDVKMRSRGVSIDVIRGFGTVEASDVDEHEVVWRASFEDGVAPIALTPVFERTVMMPEAAGDIVYDIIGQEADLDAGSETTLATTTFALGTGAVILEDATRVTTTVPYVCYCRLTPTGVETRATSTATANNLAVARRSFTTDSA
jgi:hypothetical protein